MNEKRGAMGLVRAGIWTGLFLVVGVVGARALVKMRKPAKRKATAAVLSVQIKTQRVRERKVALSLDGVGTVQALRTVRLVPEIAGQVSYVSPLLKEGATVKKGDLLLRVDSRSIAIEYRRLKGQASSLQKQIRYMGQALSLSAGNLSRNRRLMRSKAIDRGSFDAQQMQYVERKQRLESMRQSLSNIQSQLRSTSLRWQKTRIRAPFDARVTAASVEKGAYVGPGQSVATLESLYSLEIPVSFPVSALRKVRDARGRVVDHERLVSHLATLPAVKIWQSDAALPVWKGRVVRVGGKLDLSTRTVPVWIRVELRQVRKLRGRRQILRQPTLLPGTFCKVRLPIRQARSAIVVPKQAVYGGGVAYLAVNNKIQARKVQVSHIHGDTAILRRGLKPGERLIVSPLVDPIVGTRVREAKAN